VNGVRLYIDVEGCGLATRDRYMAAWPTIVLVHGGPGADHSLFKPEFSAMADAAQVVYQPARLVEGPFRAFTPQGWCMG
jgi:dipeptidyl aminopeptidase/acylaminoacyl peptidase